MAESIDFAGILERVKNWGRWGADDELGAFNYITPERVVRAGQLIRQGKRFSLAIPLDRHGPQTGRGTGRINPVHLMSVDGGDEQAGHMGGDVHYNDDWIFMPLQCSTQWDAFSHIFYDGTMYNGVDARVVSSAGAERNGIDKLHRSIAGRGVLLDVARYKGTEVLEPGYPITAADLDGAARTQGVSIEPGDILCVRTGWRGKYVRERNRDAFNGPQPGLSITTAEWVHAKQVAAVTSDNVAVEVIPFETPGTPLPLHVALIRNAGVMFGEIWDYEELAADCAADGVYEFMLVATPLRIPGAVGSPLNPLAIK